MAELSTRQPTRRPGLRWTREAIIAAIVDWHGQHGRIPLARDWLAASETHPTNQTVRRLFGGWDVAIEAAAARDSNLQSALDRELKLNGSLQRALRSSRRAGLRWTPELISYAIRIWYQRNDRTPSPQEWARAGEDNPSSSTVIRIFGSWESALSYALPALTEEQFAA